jgi:hypothetical protein
VYGPAAGYGSQGPTIFPSQIERSTIFDYRENVHHDALDTVQKSGWRTPGNVNIESGRGYRVWINKYSLGTGNNKFDNRGTIAQGAVNFPTMTRTQTFANCEPYYNFPGGSSVPCGEENRGWNLMANPYPCPIDWDATGALTWTKPAQMNNVFYTYNAQGAGYRAYVGAGGSLLGATYGANTNTPPNVIPSSQAFFVKLSSPGTYSANLAINENAKVTNTNGTFSRTAVAGNQVKIRLSSIEVPNYQYDGMVKFDPSATYGFDHGLDVDPFTTSNFDFSLVSEDGTPLLLNTVPLLTDFQVIPVRMDYKGRSGNYKFNFLDGESISNGADVYLRDNYLGTMTSMNVASEYPFVAIMNDPTGASDRFEIVVTASITGVSKSINSIGLSIYPNPSSSTSKVTIGVNGAKGSKASIVIVDVVGKVVYTDNMTISADAKTSEKSIDLGLAAGVYTVKVSTTGKTFTDKLVIR